MTKEQILALRKKMEKTQPEFARRLRVASATVSRWECGTKHPGIVNLRKLKRLAVKYGLLPEVNHDK